jgi:hypothetical protein
MSKYILNTTYLKPRWVKDPQALPGAFCMKKVSDDALIMDIKDDETNTSDIKIIERPTIEFYTIKDPSTAKPYNEMFISKDLVDTHVVEYSKRDLEICKYLGIKNEYKRLKALPYSKENRELLNSWMNENVYKSPLVYGADIDVEDFYKTKFIEENGSEVPKILNISFFDIETYIYKFKEQVDQNNPKAPINVITYINTKNKIMYALLLKIDEITMQKEIEKDIQNYIKEYIEEDFKNDPDIKINIMFFDSEPMLINVLFDIVHDDKPDFMLAWNSNYDFKYIIGRGSGFKMDISKLFCHPDVPDQYKQFSYTEDSERFKKAFGDKKKPYSRMWDWITAPSYTTYIDQMSLYSNLRKRTLEQSYKLDSIAEKEIGANKVDLHEYGMTIRNAPFKNFKIFLKYSMRDTYLLYKMMEKLDDCTMFLMLAANTKLQRGMNISFVIKNAFMAMFRQRNEVIGNTIDYGVNEKIDGAIVSDPELVDSYPITLYGKKTALYKFVTDFDAKSEYPSLMLQFRIGKNTVFTKIVCIVDENEKFIMSGREFNQFIQTKDTSIVQLCNKLYGLPTIEQVLSDLEKKIIN